MSLTNRPNARFSSGRVIFGIAAFLLALVLLSVFLLFRHAHDPLDASIERHVQRLAGFSRGQEQKGILSVADQERLVKISTYIQKRQEMSDGDVDFWIALLHKGPLKDTPSNRGLFYSDVLGDAVGKKRLSPSSSRKMYDAVLPFVSDAAYAKTIDPTDTEVDPNDPSSPRNLVIGKEDIALMLLAQTRDPRALDVLAGIARNSPSPLLKATAREYHDKLAAALR